MPITSPWLIFAHFIQIKKVTEIDCSFKNSSNVNVKQNKTETSKLNMAILVKTDTFALNVKPG